MSLTKDYQWLQTFGFYDLLNVRRDLITGKYNKQELVQRFIILENLFQHYCEIIFLLFHEQCRNQQVLLPDVFDSSEQLETVFNM